jgi:hypothetical protein
VRILWGLIMLVPASVGLWQLVQQPLSWKWGAVLMAFCALIVLGIKSSYVRERCLGSSADFLWSSLSAAGGALATYALAQYTPLGSVAASGVVGICAGQFLAKGKLDFPAYAGAFVGMSSPLVLASLPEVALAGLLTGIIYEAVHGVFDGVGGRLGTMAAAAVLLTVLLFGGGCL